MRLAPLVARAHSLRGGDIYCINNLLGTVEEWRQATVLGYHSMPHPIRPKRGDVGGRIRARGEEVHCGATARAGWPDAAYRDQTSEGEFRLGHATGLMASTLRGPCRRPP